MFSNLANPCQISYHWFAQCTKKDGETAQNLFKTIFLDSTSFLYHCYLTVFMRVLCFLYLKIVFTIINSPRRQHYKSQLSQICFILKCNVMYVKYDIFFLSHLFILYIEVFRGLSLSGWMLPCWNETLNVSLFFLGNFYWHVLKWVHTQWVTEEELSSSYWLTYTSVVCWWENFLIAGTLQLNTCTL